MQFTPKSFQQLTSAMAAKMSAETPITDFSPGSVVLTLLEAAAQEDFQQYVQMLNVIRNYNIDTTEGEDLDKRAFEYGLTRIQPSAHSGFVTITDTRFTKIFSKIYAGLPGPTATSTTINVDDASSFPASGAVYIGRGTVNTEGPIAYSSAPVNNGSYWTITLDVALSNDHGTDETVILSQFSNRTVPAGTEIEIPESDTSDRVPFELNQTVELLDGENEVTNVLVTCLTPGGFKVPANSIVAFTSSPFTGAAVNNPLPFVNGRDLESDQQLRDRIRDFIQSLSRGTPRSVTTGITGLVDENTNSSIVSANIVPPVVLADGPSRVYIDNGRGLEPELDTVGLETIIAEATGGEVFFQLEEFPVVKASLISQSVEPFNLVGTETIIVQIGTEEETFSFLEEDFDSPGIAKATEVSEAVNNRAILFEARTITDSKGKHIMLTPKARQNENFLIDPVSTAQTIFNFPTGEVFTAKIYKNDKLLVKDGLTAAILSEAQPFNMSTLSVTTTDGDITVTSNSRIVTKAAAGSNPFRQFVHPGFYIKFSSDSDIFYRKVRTVVSDTKLILEEAYPISGGGVGDLIIWNSPQLEVAANGDREQTEIVSFSPNDFATPSQALASEVLARLLLEVQLSRSEIAVNNTKVKIISELENSADSKIQILGGYAAIALGFNTVTSLSGTLTFTGEGTTVTGSGTAFTTELEEGQWIKANAHGNGSWSKIETIESDTILYLTEGYRGPNAAAVAASRTNFSSLIEGKNKDYVLNRSNGQIELTEPLVAGDSLTAGSVNTRAFTDSIPELFDFTSLGASSTLIVCVDGGSMGNVTTGDAIAPYDSFTDTNLIGYGTNFFVGFYVEWTSGNNIGENSYIATYNTSTGQFTTTTGFTNPILVTDRFKLCQVLTFVHATDFADPANVQAVEVVAAINSQLLGGQSEVKADGSVRIRTSNFTEAGKIQVKGGSANTVLNFGLEESSNELTNLAYVESSNSDRDGNSAAPGFTLGPAQTLIAILDGDSINKTFSTTLEVRGTVDSGASGTFTDAGVGGDYTENDYFNDCWLYWETGSNAGKVQRITDYTGVTGVFTFANVFSTSVAPVSGDQFILVPRTAENVVKFLNDFKITTLSIVGTIEAVGISGDFVQISTKTPGSKGKVFVTGGSANSFGISIQSIPAGAPVNDLTLNSKTGLFEGLIVDLTVDALVTTPDVAAPYDTIKASSLITGISGYFTGTIIEFLTGNNAGFKTTVASYNNVDGEIVLTTAAPNAINTGDSFRLHKNAFVSSITGTQAPFTIELVDSSEVAIDVSGYTPQRNGAVRDLNGLGFSTVQVEGIDGYKFFTGLIRKAQWTIDGLDRDPANYPGIGAAGTQFEVLTPVLVKLKLIVKVTPESGISLSSISSSVANAVLEYVNSRKVGEDVILSEIVAAAQSISGVFDVEILNFTENITISDGELVRLDNKDLVIG